MSKFDLKKTLKAHFTAPKDTFEDITLPAQRYIQIDGKGDPNTSAAYADALGWLYGTAYKMKFAAKAEGHDYVVPPLEALWWSDTPEDFTARNKDAWHWTVMLMVPDLASEEMFTKARDTAAKKLGSPPPSLRLAAHETGRCLQTLHIGSYDDEGPTLAKLHDEIMPGLGVTFAGHHHEVYLSDPRRTAPEKLKTILRQPVRPL